MKLQFRWSIIECAFRQQVICEIAKGTPEDVNRAVEAAKAAYEGDWGKMNARDRGDLMFRYQCHYI